MNTSKDGYSSRSVTDTSKNMQNLWIDTKEKSQWDWEALPYHEESRENESYNDIVVDTTKVNEKQLDIKTKPNYS